MKTLIQLAMLGILVGTIAGCNAGTAPGGNTPPNPKYGPAAKGSGAAGKTAGNSGVPSKTAVPQ